jgi:hypothetical protein
MMNSTGPTCGTKSDTSDTYPPFVCTLDTLTHGPSFHIAHDTDDHEVYRWPVARITDPARPAAHISRRTAAAVLAQLDRSGLLHSDLILMGWPSRTDQRNISEHVQAPTITRALARDVLDQMWAGIFDGHHDSTLYDSLIRLGWPIRETPADGSR